MQIESFAPLVDERSTRLILGTIPGEASLAANQYYAFSRNAFWSVMHALFAIPLDADYPQRCALLLQQGVAVWDVMQSCYRSSSLDSAIVADSVIANDIVGLLQAYPAIRRIYFNGATAEQAFRRHVQPQLGSDWLDNRLFRLPSTSPANARLTLQQKIDAWSALRHASA